MNSFIVLLLAVLPFVHCAVDPTTICMPEKLTADIYDSKRAVTGVVAVDFTSGKAGATYADGARRVIDLNSDLLYSVDKDLKCTRAPYPPEAKKQFTRCLPAGAVQPGENVALGLPSDRLMLQYWSIDYGSGINVMFALTTGTPAIPVLRQTVRNGTDDGMLVYANPSINANATLFAIPLTCSDAVIV